MSWGLTYFKFCVSLLGELEHRFAVYLKMLFDFCHSVRWSPGSLEYEMSEEV